MNPNRWTAKTDGPMLALCLDGVPDQWVALHDEDHAESLAAQINRPGPELPIGALMELASLREHQRSLEAAGLDNTTPDPGAAGSRPPDADGMVEVLQ